MTLRKKMKRKPVIGKAIRGALIKNFKKKVDTEKEKTLKITDKEKGEKETLRGKGEKRDKKKQAP